MRRSAALLLVFAVGAFVGWLTARPQTRRQKPPEPAPVAEISVIRPDPSMPEGCSAVRLTVVAAGTQAEPIGKQEPHEWCVVVWRPSGDGEPGACERFRCVPK